MSDSQGTSCVVCRGAIGGPLYTSPESRSVTSLCEVLERKTFVYLCRTCGHLQTPPAIDDVARYYDEDYKILVASEDEDQLYEIRDGKKIYRSEHQLDVLERMTEVRRGARVLDFGCAKAMTTRRLFERRPDVAIHLFDVSSMYQSFWRTFCDESRFATYQTPAGWDGTMDLVTSYYALEHVERPRAIVEHVHRLLRDGGLFYCVVPNVYQNVGDFVVVDHVNHFSPSSIEYLLRGAGFVVEKLDANQHESAIIVTARKSTSAHSAMAPGGHDETLRAAEKMAAYWSGFAARVRAFEREHATGPAAIYGSGFYGTFTATCMANLERVTAFLDQNPHRQGKRLMGRPIVTPADLAADVRTVYVGLNPKIARREIAKVEGWAKRELAYFWPDET